MRHAGQFQPLARHPEEVEQPRRLRAGRSRGRTAGRPRPALRGAGPSARVDSRPRRGPGRPATGRAAGRARAWVRMRANPADPMPSRPASGCHKWLDDLISVRRAVRPMGAVHAQARPSASTTSGLDRHRRRPFLTRSASVPDGQLVERRDRLPVERRAGRRRVDREGHAGVGGSADRAATVPARRPGRPAAAACTGRPAGRWRRAGRGRSPGPADTERPTRRTGPRTAPALSARPTSAARPASATSGRTRSGSSARAAPRPSTLRPAAAQDLREPARAGARGGRRRTPARPPSIFARTARPGARRRPGRPPRPPRGRAPRRSGGSAPGAPSRTGRPARGRTAGRRSRAGSRTNTDIRGLPAPRRGPRFQRPWGAANPLGLEPRLASATRGPGRGSAVRRGVAVDDVVMPVRLGVEPPQVAAGRRLVRP